MDIERKNFLEELEEQNRRYEIFKAKFEAVLSKRHGITIGDCTDEETLRVEFEDGVTPEDFVEHIATKYDLDRIDKTLF